MSEESRPAVEEPSLVGGVDVQVVRELLVKAREEGLSLTGPGGLLSRITKTVLESALNAETG